MAVFEVNPKEFSSKHAEEVMEQYNWEYGPDDNLLEKCLRHLGMECIMIATEQQEETDLDDITERMVLYGGMCKLLDGSCGLKITGLIRLEARQWEFNKVKLEKLECI